MFLDRPHRRFMDALGGASGGRETERRSIEADVAAHGPVIRAEGHLHPGETPGRVPRARAGMACEASVGASPHDRLLVRLAQRQSASVTLRKCEGQHLGWTQDCIGRQGNLGKPPKRECSVQDRGHSMRFSQHTRCWRPPPGSTRRDWGAMFQGGERSLQDCCGRFDSDALHWPVGARPRTSHRHKTPTVLSTRTAHSISLRASVK